MKGCPVPITRFCVITQVRCQSPGHFRVSFKTNFNTILQFTLRGFKWPLPFEISDKICFYFSSFSWVLHTPPTSYDFILSPCGVSERLLVLHSRKDLIKIEDLSNMDISISYKSEPYINRR